MKVYRCVACEKVGNFQLKRHLEVSSDCFDYYRIKFDVLDWKQLFNKMRNLNRPSEPRRNTYVRRLVYANNTQAARLGTTVTESIHNFVKNTSLANYKMCIICNQCFMGAAVQEINNSNPVFFELDLENKNELKRMNKYWLCTKCKDSREPAAVVLSQPKFKLYNIDGFNILCPTNSVQADDIDVQPNTLIMIPKTFIKGNKTTQSYDPQLNKLNGITNSLLTTLYEMRKLKFNHAKWFSDIFDGEVLNENRKQLGSISRVADYSKIRGSDSWNYNKRAALQSMFEQYGNSAIGFSLDVEINNMQTIATSMICTGDIITLEFIGGASNDYKECNYYN